VLDLALAGFIALLLAMGMRRPFLWVLAYVYVDIVAPQKFSYFLLASIPLSLIVFLAAFGGWLFADNKQGARFTYRQGLMIVLLLYCGYTTLTADFAVEALSKWSWVWKALVFAIFLPLTLRTRLRIEGTVLAMVLAASSIVITGGIKTAAGGGGYGSLHFFVNDNTGLYEGSIISCVAIAIVPLVLWLAKCGTVFPSDWRVKLFAGALIFACLLIPVGTQARTGLICIGVLAMLYLRSTKRKFLYMGLIGAAGIMAVPFLPQSFTQRMSTIENHEADESASTRLAVWAWTWEYAKDHPLGGGFEAYRGNKISYEAKSTQSSGNTTEVQKTAIQDEGRAFHSSYFEMLGEQGWPGIFIWGFLHLSGLWQMERIRRRWKSRTGPTEQWQAPLATALQQAHIVYLVGSLFVGIAFQAFILMLIGVQCGLWSYLKRIDSPRPAMLRGPRKLQPLGTSSASPAA
jgi:probable O-glycosylation ligase (exosortase A-associated)